MSMRLTVILIALVMAVSMAFFLFLFQRSFNVSLLEVIVNYSTQLVEKVGYPGIFILMTLESALFPIPSEIVMPFAGFLSWSGKLDLLLVVVSGTLGNLLGSYLLYRLGEGPGLHFVQKYGKYLLVEEAEIMKSLELFSKYGSLIIFIGRMLPAVRTVISLPAGMSKMNLGKFLLFTLLGSIPWNFALTYLGWILAENWIIIERYAKILDYAVLLIVIVMVSLYYFYKSKSKPCMRSQPSYPANLPVSVFTHRSPKTFLN